MRSIAISGARIIAYVGSNRHTVVLAAALARPARRVPHLLRTATRPAVAAVECAGRGICQFSSWTTIAGLQVSVEGGHTYFLCMMPPSASLTSAGKGYTLQLTSAAIDLQNRWQIRYLRDGKPIATFGLGHQVLSPNDSLSLPLCLPAVDEPPPGTHRYSVQLKYTGNQLGGKFGELHIINGNLRAIRLH